MTEWTLPVAQVSNLPYRRFPIGWAFEKFKRPWSGCGLETRATAGWKPALRVRVVNVFTVFLLWCASTGGLPAQEPTTETAPPQVRFTTIDLFVDPGDRPLSAYQVKISFENGTRIAGIEGGEHAAFREPPFYDPRAIQHDRVILAAFNTASEKELPQGRTRVATLHVQVTGAGPVEFSSALELAATLDGKRIPAELSVEERNAK